MSTLGAWERMDNGKDEFSGALAYLGMCNERECLDRIVDAVDARRCTWKKHSMLSDSAWRSCFGLRRYPP